jgi:signal transduction histidine kinase
MFFYNQRAMVFGCSALFLLLLSCASIAYNFDDGVHTTLKVLVLAWIAGVVVTLALHRPFRLKLQTWAASPLPREAPPLFDRYFLLDSALVFMLVLAGEAIGVHLETFAFLLFANTFLYAAYVRSAYPSSRSISILMALLTCAAVGVAIRGLTEDMDGDLISRSIKVAPILAMILITLFSISMISWLRTAEHSVTRRHLSLLGKFENILAGPNLGAASGHWERDQDRYSEKQFRKQIAIVLKELCSLRFPFWYSSACVWLSEEHQDRGRVFLPAASYAFNANAHSPDGIDGSSGFLDIPELRLVPSLREEVVLGREAIWRFNTALNAPAALVPLKREDDSLGVLVLYGEAGGPPAQRQEEEFLKSLGSIMANTMEQWEGRYRAFPQKEMDNLFSCSSLDEVFPKAAEILRKYLFAAGCMLIFRPNPDKPEMSIAAMTGFGPMNRSSYTVGRGLTGKCAASGQIMRVDNVSNRRVEFDSDLLSALERAHGHPVVSWMAIPINGSNHRNYGVIKVVNSRFRCRWFTKYDERIGADLALRLHVIIERFLHIKHTEEAREEATQSAQAAERAKQLAEQTARQRQQDLMNVTHQLQGALIAVVGALSGIKQDGPPKTSRLLLEHGQALVEDALALAYGTFTTLAREAGRETAFTSEEINAPRELRKLSQRLQMTNARDDLKFSYKEEPGFPLFRMDRNAFTSVMFSLIHNAMKYADSGTVVTLECGFERSTGEAALKVKTFGEPIDITEKEAIFEKFRRGKAVERGRRHSGVGLGLWVARELMRALGGDLTVELSQNDPKLSVFVVHIPCEEIDQS